jgi:hypothetical protein
MQYMIPWTDISCVRIQYARNCCTMIQRYTKILTLYAPWCPLWDLLFILQAGTENVARAAPYVQMFQMFIV